MNPSAQRLGALWQLTTRISPSARCPFALDAPELPAYVQDHVVAAAFSYRTVDLDPKLERRRCDGKPPRWLLSDPLSYQTTYRSHRLGRGRLDTRASRLQSGWHRKVTQASELTGTSTPDRRPRRCEAGAGDRDPRHAAGVRVHRLLRHLLGRKHPADEVDRRRGAVRPQAGRGAGAPALRSRASARATGSSPTTSTSSSTSSRPRPASTTGSRSSGTTCRRSSTRPRDAEPEKFVFRRPG